MINKWALLVLISFSLGTIHAQTVTVAKFDQIEKLIASPNDTTYVFNFWATWCVPCVKEFPSFQALASKHKNEKVKVIMCSLDFKSEYEKSLIPFLSKHPIDAAVYLIDDPDADKWIPKVDTKWGGEIPVTLIINGAGHIRSFYLRDFTPDELEQTFTKTINQSK